MSGMKIEVDMDWFGHVGKSIPVPVFQCFFLKVKAGIPFFSVWNVGNIFQHDPCGKQQGPRFLRMACSGSAGRNTPSHLARFWHIMWWWHLSNKKGPGLLQFMVKDSHKAGTWDIWPLYLPVSLYCCSICPACTVSAFGATLIHFWQFPGVFHRCLTLSHVCVNIIKMSRRIVWWSQFPSGNLT